MANGNNQGMDAYQLNMMARQTIVRDSVIRKQTIFSKTFDPAVERNVEIAPRYAGFILGFWINIRANYAVGAAGSALTKTPFGPANLLKEIRFDDLSNNTRVQTTGWHLALLDGARANRPYLSSAALEDGSIAAQAYPIDFRDDDSSLISAPVSIAQSANADVAMTYFMPLAYSDQDLTGGIFAAVNNATARMLLTLNDQSVQARTQAGGSDAVFVTADAATQPTDVTVGTFTVEVTQVYYDNLPRSEQGYILPVLDMGTYYDIKNTAVSSITANQDFPIAYSNYRDFLSTICVYRNRAAASGAQGFINAGDINQWKLETANFTNMFNLDPRYINAQTRQTLGAGMPEGVYYFPSRNKPVSTQTFGNTNIVLNAQDVQADAAVLVGYESFFRAGTVGLASGLTPAG